MGLEIQFPTNRLSKDAVKVWVIGEVLSNALVALVLGVLFYLNHRFQWWGWVFPVLVLLAGLLVVFAVWGIAIEPYLKYKHWRYEVDEEYLQLKHGALKEVHELVPMTKIQAVGTNQGPLLRRYKLSSISIETMGSSHTIPALPDEIAKDLRNQIAHYAKVREVEA
ncbi:hypothetical protein N781_17590 [Pontibacillus halophilus JSM 076056 = DSM 19796]|uniref:YdbS-like PH domain-containing protein n=1 Tax=Pontibacillus halophilus JSM 076056 = DSM 19796 TaxID=1385510 RepID=A0A0A5GFV0_9BACI|nr:PH domain-containing protein [Pontibacillus halophilus]KGX92121.1 hypothetical protein N781_17590 [Pontibacillus halophilus JSM 076056 = DSM 19796]